MIGWCLTALSAQIGYIMPCPWAAPQVLNRVCLFPLPPLPFPTSHPHPSSYPYPSRVEGSQSHLPSPFPSPPSSHFPGGPTPKPARGSGERYKLPQWGLGRSPSRQMIWCISGPKGAALMATVFVHFIRIDVIFCDFDAEGSIKLAIMHGNAQICQRCCSVRKSL